MTKKQLDSAVFRVYFSGFYKWNAVVFVLFFAAYILCILWGSWGKYWIVPICYLLIILLSLRYYRLFFTALRDMQKPRITKKRICVHSVTCDKRLNYYNNGGVMIGKEKCRITDSEGHTYRVVLDGNHIVEMRANNHYSGAQIEINYLEHSLIVLHMKQLSSDDASRHLKTDFSIYFGLQTG